jgi:hypothetical protein
VIGEIIGDLVYGFILYAIVLPLCPIIFAGVVAAMIVRDWWNGK